MKVWLLPEVTVTVPDGLIEPLEPAEAVIVRFETLPTVTVALETGDVPPAPVQVMPYVVVVVRLPVDTLPDVAPPVANPVPVHEVALVEDHERMED